MKRTIKILIAGQPYQVRSDADEAYVQKLADFVNTRVSALLGNRHVATQSDMVLTALQLADELQSERQARTRLRGQVRHHSQRMLEYLSRLAECPPEGAPQGRSRS